MYLLQGIHSRTFCLHTQTNFRFHRQKVSFPQLAWGDFHTQLLASLAPISMQKITCDCQEKKYTFLSSQNRHKFFIFSASEALIQISQPANWPMFFFFQLAQILPVERVFCRAASSGTPDNICLRGGLFKSFLTRRCKTLHEAYFIRSLSHIHVSMVLSYIVFIVAVPFPRIPFTII